MDHGDGDHHDEQFIGDGDPQSDKKAIPSHNCLMSFLSCSTFTRATMFLSTYDSEVERSLGKCFKF